MVKKIYPLVIGNLSIPIPIIQGGMGVQVSTASLASAVANCGAAGTIASVGLDSNPGRSKECFIRDSREALQREITKARMLTSGVIGVNILAALSNFEDLARTAASEDIDYIISGAGLPLRLPEYAENSSVKLIPIVSSVRVARIIIDSWKKKYDRVPDALIVEGPLAGGHLGFSLDDIMTKQENVLEGIIIDVLSVVREYEKKWDVIIPVIAAGGIFDGSDISRFLNLGVQGVQMGTRFVATHECNVPYGFKQKYINAKDEDIVLIKSPVGLPGRAVRSRFTDSLMQHTLKKIACRYRCLKTCNVATAPYCIARMLLNAVDEDKIEDAIIFAGRNVSRIKEIVSVQELISLLVTETEASLEQVGV